MSDLSRSRIFFHICCAPDATVTIERLNPDYNVTGFFYNPNIHPGEEYNFRINEMRWLARMLGIPLIEGEYERSYWFSLIKGLEEEPEGGKRCEVCIRMRLEKTAALACQEGFPIFGTALTVSPHKNAPLINRIGLELANRYGLTFLETDFKKGDGFKRSVELSMAYGLYRQKYCGCIYSLDRYGGRPLHDYDSV